MELKAFADIVSRDVKKRLGSGYEISVITNRKNNSMERTGIMFRQRSSRVSPTIYIEDLLDAYNNDQKTMEDIVGEVVCRYQKSKEVSTELRWLDMSSELWQEKIIYRLISREQNTELLNDIPYIPFLDLAITFHLVVAMDGTCMQTIQIDKNLQERWELSTEKLFKRAAENTERLLPLRINSLDGMVAGLLGAEPLSSGEDGGRNDMTVLTNCLGIGGASVILYECVLDRLADKLGTDLYIIPSSIHEVIVLPVSEHDVHSALITIVREINQRYVSPDEILSDRVYIYSREERKFRSSFNEK